MIHNQCFNNNNNNNNNNDDDNNKEKSNDNNKKQTKQKPETNLNATASVFQSKVKVNASFLCSLDLEHKNVTFQRKTNKTSKQKSEEKT